jgi:hypothetical protein
MHQAWNCGEAGDFSSSGSGGEQREGSLSQEWRRTEGAIIITVEFFYCDEVLIIKLFFFILLSQLLSNCI